MAVEFSLSLDGSLMSIDRSDIGSFLDDGIQEHLLPYFTVEGISVDPYDGGRFVDEQLDTLIQQLEAAIRSIGLESSEWPFTDEAELNRYFTACNTYSIEPLHPRDQALRVLHDALRLASKARDRGEFLVFCGD